MAGMNGEPLRTYDDLVALAETLDILRDPSALAAIREADDEVVRGDVVRGVDAVRGPRPRP